MRRPVILTALFLVASLSGCSRVDAPAVCSAPDDCTSGVCTDGRCESPTDAGSSDDTAGTQDAADDAATSSDATASTDTARDDVEPAEPCLSTTPSVDLGEVELGDTATAEIEIVNCGPVPLQLADAVLDADDGFTLASPSSLTVAANEVVLLPVTFTATLSGVFEGTITVTTETGQTDTTRLRAEALTPLSDDACIEVLPEGIEFGTIEQGTRFEAPIIVRNCGSFTLRFEDEFTLSNDTDWFLFPVFEGDLEPGDRLENVVEFIGFAPAGEKFAVFEQAVISLGSGDRLEMRIRASGRIEP